MPEQIGVKVRTLPDGKFRHASEVGWTGRLLELDLLGESYPLGTLLEIENGGMVYLGELQQQTGSKAVVAVEHSVNRGTLKPIQDAWGQP